MRKEDKEGNEYTKNKYEEFIGFSDPMVDRSILFDTRGVRKTQTLFVDVNNNKNYEPIYTMRDQDYKGCISAYLIYMNSVDEYDAAMKLVGSIDHWEKLCDLKWFKEGGQSFTGIEQWRKDMEQRDLMLAKRTLMENVKRFKDVSAARALLNMNKKKPETPQTKKQKETEEKKGDKESRDDKVASILNRIKNKDNG